MFRVVNGSGTAVGSKLQLDGIQMAGKTGTAQVRRLVSRGSVGDWKSRDHALFVCYAPADAPKYAMAVVVEHGTFGARAAAPIARDTLTYLFDPPKAWAQLVELEKAWGGNPTERMAAKYRAFSAQYGTSAPKVGNDDVVEEAMNRTPASPAVEADKVYSDAERGEADAAASPSSSPSPEATAAPLSPASAAPEVE
jgi:penicillin-binding protein 2